MKLTRININKKLNSNKYLALIAFIIILMNSFEAFCQNRTVGITFKGQQNNNQGFDKDFKLYEKSYAVVIGINKYKNLPELNGAVNDADEVSKTLMTQGFIIDKILDADATLSKIKETLGDALPRKLKRDDRVLIYFAGHGVSTGTGDTSMGYLLPVEGDKDKLRSTGISMREIQDWFADYPSKHVMFVADACYSGLALSTRSVGLPQSVKDYMQQITSKPVRLAITAGGAGEEANEWRGHGLFTYYFLEALKGAGSADSNSDGILTSDEMIAFIKPQVSQTALSQYKRQQNPLIGRSGEGEFLFILKDELKVMPNNQIATIEQPEKIHNSSTGIIKNEESYKQIDTSKYDEINKEIEKQEKQNELYQEKLKAAWNTIQKAIDSQSISSSKKIALLKTFKKDFPSNNPYMDKVEQRIEYEEINEAERSKSNNSNYISFPNLGEIANKISDEINKQNEQANREKLYQDKLKSEWVKIENTINNDSDDPLKKIALLKAFKNNFPSNNPYMDKIEQKIRQEETKIKEQKSSSAIASISKNSDKENEQAKKEQLYKEKIQAEWLKIEKIINNDSEPPQNKIALLKTFKKDFPSNNPYMEKIDERIETEETNEKENKQNLVKVETEKQSDKKEYVPLPGI